MEETLQHILNEITEMRREINEIKNTLDTDIKNNCQKMGGHIDFIENVYETVKAPLKLYIK